jgi:hypothetical protein
MVKMAEIESGVNHVRSQTDMDRRAQAERNRDVSARFDKMDEAHGDLRLDVARVSDACRRLEFQTGVQTETQSKILSYIAEQRGSLRLLKFLLGTGVAFELARLFMEHAK